MTRTVQDLVASVPNPLPRRASILVKFLTAGAVMSLAWYIVLQILGKGWGHSGSETAWLLAIMSASTILAAVVYLRLPDRTVDRYHKFGKMFALFLAVNVVVSSSVVVHEVFLTDVVTVGDTLAMKVLGTWFLASIFLPGPYLGTLIAARWSR